ncbi:PAS domain-containing protein, partial [Alicyclobacillus acidoterrestris]
MNLQESLERATRIANLGHWDWDIRKDNHTYSRVMFQIMGMEREPKSFSYQDFLSRIHADDVESLDRCVKQSLATGSPFDTIYRLQREDEIRYIHTQDQLSNV